MTISTSEQVFISYNSADKDVARDLGLFLIAEDVGVWFDEWEIAAGDSIVDQINAGLKGCTHFLILWSKNAARSNWVRRELSSTIHTALQSDAPKIIPVVLDEAQLPELLRDIRYIHYRGGDENDRRALVQAVRGVPPSQNLIKAIVRKYKEVIEDPDDPFGLAACPKCGSYNLHRGTADRGHKSYLIIACRECEWSDYT